jgi:DNA-binding NtrC family response regulator
MNAAHKHAMTVNYSMVDGRLSLRVLVVDDEALLLWSITEALKQRGHTVLAASSANAARFVMSNEHEPIDAVLLDLRLPDSDDLQLLEEVRRRLPTTGIVLMTAFGQPDITDAALQMGAFAVLAKPFDLHSLEPLLRDARRYARPH